MVNINEQVQRKKLMFEFKHPKYYKELKKNLTKENFSDKGEEDEKIQVWKDEIAMHGGTISDEVKVKDLKKLNKDLKEEKYNGGTAYTEFLKLFSKEKNEK